jgi:hypothetical protein
MVRTNTPWLSSWSVIRVGLISDRRLMTSAYLERLLNSPVTSSALRPSVWMKSERRPSPATTVVRNRAPRKTSSRPKCGMGGPLGEPGIVKVTKRHFCPANAQPVMAGLGSKRTPRLRHGWLALRVLIPPSRKAKRAPKFLVPRLAAKRQRACKTVRSAGLARVSWTV